MNTPTYTILLAARSYCVTQQEAQRFVNQFEARAEAMDVVTIDGERASINVRDVVRIWQHDGKRNGELLDWLEKPTNVIPLFRDVRLS